MEFAAATKPDVPNDTENPKPEAIAVQDRIVVVMFLIVGLALGGIILVDLIVGFFR